MEVLREHRDSVMAVLEAFVYDPLLNWRLMDSKWTPLVSLLQYTVLKENVVHLWSEYFWHWDSELKVYEEQLRYSFSSQECCSLVVKVLENWSEGCEFIPSNRELYFSMYFKLLFKIAKKSFLSFGIFTAMLLW